MCYHKYDYYKPEDEIPHAVAAMNIYDLMDQQFYHILGPLLR